MLVQTVPPPTNADEGLRLFAAIQRIIDAAPGDATGTPRTPLLVGSPKVFSARASAAANTESGRALLQGAALIVPTSGTTTNSAYLVVLDAAALRFAADQTHNALSGPGSWVIALPLAHIAGIQMLVRCAVAGTKPVFPKSWPSFDPALFASAIRAAKDPASKESATKESATPALPQPLYASLVSAQLGAILRAGPEVTASVAQLDAVLVGGGRIDPDLLSAARAVGIRAHTTYGMTETCGGCVYDGKPLPGTDIVIAPTDTPTDATEKQSGRILLGTGSLMRGYLDQPSPFESVAERRYFRTSDLGYLDDQGLHVTGRVDEIIKSGGVKVHLGAVARAIETDPHVQEAHCLGKEDPVWGQSVAAIIVPTTPDLDEEAVATLAWSIRQTVKNLLGPTYMPRTVVAVCALPRTGLSKPHTGRLRTILEDAIRSGVAWQR